MLSIILSVRNTAQLAGQCLGSILRVTRALGSTPLEVILLDDASDPAQRIPEMFADFQRQLPKSARTVIFQFKEQQHYTRVLAYGLSEAEGDTILFVSHDMMLTVDYLRTLLAVAASDRSIGLVRGTSTFVDSFPQHQVVPPLLLRSFEDIEAFGRYVSDYWGLQWVEDAMLTGDSMLITRAAIEKIGVYDPRYFGYFGDIDYGLRLQRAGFKMVCAKGAWLWHEGAGAYKSLQAQTGEDYGVIHARRMQTVSDAYGLFREKWDISLPDAYAGMAALDFAHLRGLPPPAGGEYQPTVTPDPSVCDIRAL